MSIINNQINYIELKSTNLAITKTFYQEVFGWRFTDYGPTYIAFEGAGLDGGFEFTELPITNGALVVLYHNDLTSVIEKITNAGGSIVKKIFEFPGGKRFHFVDPSGNELAIWSEP